jgi:putative PIN family toxin of toxin-antitoxin system
MRPDRVFVDTNVLVSGIAFRGNEYDLLMLAKAGQVRLVLAEAVVLEARRIAAWKFPVRQAFLEDYLVSVKYESVPRPDELAVRRAGMLVRDPKDAPILASILASKPDIALTGDKDLLTDEVKAVAPTCRCAEYLAQRSETDD